MFLNFYIFSGVSEVLALGSLFFLFQNITILQPWVFWANVVCEFWLYRLRHLVLPPENDFFKNELLFLKTTLRLFFQHQTDYVPVENELSGAIRLVQKICQDGVGFKMAFFSNFLKKFSNAKLRIFFQISWCKNLPQRLIGGFFFTWEIEQSTLFGYWHFGFFWQNEYSSNNWKVYLRKNVDQSRSFYENKKFVLLKILVFSKR